jgi:hypothetical protein
MLARRSSQALLQHLVGYAAMFTEPTAYVALFTTPPSANDGTAAVEVAGGSYARVATTQGTSGTWGTASNTDPTTLSNTQAITFPTATNIAAPAVAPALSANSSGGSLATGTVYVKVTYVSAGGETTPSPEQSVAVTGPSGQVVVTAPASETGAIGYKVYAATTAGSEVVQNSGNSIAIGTNYTINTLATGTAAPPSTNTASWGNLVAFGLYDAASAGNLLAWDFLGNYQWLPASVTSASPGSFVTHAHGYSQGDNLIFTTVFGGTLPTGSPSLTSGVFSALLTVAAAGLTTDAFSVTLGGSAFNSTASGDGMVRKIVQQSVPAGVQPSFAAGALVLYGD